MPGAGSMVGAKALADAKPDGYTLGFLGISAAIAQYTSVSPVMMDAYTAVAGIINPELVLLVNNDRPWKTFGEFLDYAKKNPGKVKNANAGAGVIDHLYSTEFGKVAGVQFTQVPYKGWGPSLAALAGGHVDTMFVAIGPAKALIKAGKIRPLAIAAEKRHPAYPDLPTMKEGGVDIVMPFWESIVVPKGTPAATIAVLADAIGKAFADSRRAEAHQGLRPGRELHGHQGHRGAAGRLGPEGQVHGRGPGPEPQQEISIQRRAGGGTSAARRTQGP